MTFFLLQKQEMGKQNMYQSAKLEENCRN